MYVLELPARTFVKTVIRASAAIKKLIKIIEPCECP